MAAVKRTFEFDAAFEAAPETAAPEANDVVEEVIPTTIARTSPFRSPARDMQITLAQRLQEQPVHSKKDVAFGLIIGIFGACSVTGILMYATL